MEKLSPFIGNPESPNPIRLLAQCQDCNWKAELLTSQYDFVEDYEIIRESAFNHENDLEHSVTVFRK